MGLLVGRPTFARSTEVAGRVGAQLHRSVAARDRGHRGNFDLAVRSRPGVRIASGAGSRSASWCRPSSPSLALFSVRHRRMAFFYLAAGALFLAPLASASHTALGRLLRRHAARTICSACPCVSSSSAVVLHVAVSTGCCGRGARRGQTRLPSPPRCWAWPGLSLLAQAPAVTDRLVSLAGCGDAGQRGRRATGRTAVIGDRLDRRRTRRSLAVLVALTADDSARYFADDRSAARSRRGVSNGCALSVTPQDRIHSSPDCCE